MYCRSWRKKSCFWMPHGPTNEQMWCQSGQCSVTIAQFPQRPTIWPCSRSLTRSNSFTGPLLTSSVSSTSNAYTTIAVSSSHSVYSDPSARGRHNWPVLGVHRGRVDDLSYSWPSEYHPPRPHAHRRLTGPHLGRGHARASLAAGPRAHGAEAVSVHQG